MTPGKLCLASFSKIVLVVTMLIYWAEFASAQESQDPDHSPEQEAISIEEIIVTGQRSFYTLRYQIESAKLALYSSYNEFNPNDDLDVNCRRTDYTESLINTRQCWPIFFEKIVAESAQNAIILNDYFITAAPILARQHNDRFEELRANILQVADEHKSVADSLKELGTLEEAMRRKKQACMEQPAVFFIFRLCQ